MQGSARRLDVAVAEHHLHNGGGLNINCYSIMNRSLATILTYSHDWFKKKEISQNLAVSAKAEESDRNSSAPANRSMYLVKSSKWNGTGLCWSIHTFTTWSRLAPVRGLPSNRQMLSNAPRFFCFQIASLVLSVPSYCASFHTLSLSFPPSFHEECHYPSTIPAIHFASRPSSARSSWRSISRHPSGTSWQSLELERLCTMWALRISWK